MITNLFTGRESKNRYNLPHKMSLHLQHTRTPHNGPVCHLPSGGRVYAADVDYEDCIFIFMLLQKYLRPRMCCYYTEFIV